MATAYVTANSSYDQGNVIFNVANAAFNMANVAYNAQNVDYTLSNTAFSVANAAFAAANNITPQIAPSYNTANMAFNTANAAYTAANNVGPQIAPAYNTANAAFAKANSSLQNTSFTLAGDFKTTGNGDFSSSTAALKIPVGTTAQRPVGAAGMIRHNTTTSFPEWYDTSTNAWINFKDTCIKFITKIC